MPAPTLSLFARWPDMDFNQHMRNAAFLGAAEDCRMHFLREGGFPLETLMAIRLGPVVTEDRLRYRREIRLHDPFTVDLRLVGLSADAGRMRLRNTVVRDGELAATVESYVIWVDLDRRKPRPPPDDLAALWRGLERTDDYADLD